MVKKLILAFLVLALIGGGAGSLYVWWLKRDLPQIMKIEDYKPILVSEVFARGGEKIGEFKREKRILTPYEKIPKHVVQAFLAAEDDKFFEHSGINYLAIARAMLANLRAGHTVQGGSTITQQVAKTFFLSSERKISRKIKEAMLSYRLEESLRKEDILYLYLNQIFFGAESYGVAAAAQTYFRKTLDEVTVAEAALLAGLPQAPSRYSPIKNPHLAKERQRYVLTRMAEVGFISKEVAEKSKVEPITIYLEQEYNEVAPYYIETLRQLLVEDLGEATVLDGGIKVYTGLDYKAQVDAQEQIRVGLRALDKRQGYRGPIKQFTSAQEIAAFLLETRRKLERHNAPVRVIGKDGDVVPDRPLGFFQKKDAAGNVIGNLPDYLPLGSLVDAVVTKVDDKLGIATVRFAESQGLLDVGDMMWARKPDAKVPWESAPPVKQISLILKPGDVIQAKIAGDKFTSQRLQKEMDAITKKNKNPTALKDYPKFNLYAYLTLEQEPVVESALLSLDQKTQDIVSMVGGYDYTRNKYNRAIQAKRQTGSSYKAIVYLSALDKGWTPNRVVADAPIVFDVDSEAADGQEDIKRWKPHNYGNKFEGDMLFRQALVQSLNIPTVKILEDIGVSWAVDYSRKLGIFSPLNQDLSLGLGSSGVTLYEMTKVFSQIGRLGRRVHPIMVHKIVDNAGKEVRTTITLDKRFQNEIAAAEKYIEDRKKALAAEPQSADLQPAAANPADAKDGVKTAEVTDDAPQPKPKPIPQIFFTDPEQLVKPTTAFLITNILSAAITDANGTAARARALGRPAAGKTGTTSGYFDTWFIGYTPQYATGVWVGFDQEKSLGVGEAGGRTALPIWVEYMKNLHQDIPPTGFAVPDGIVFANIDKKTGKLASASSKDVVYQAFLKGTEPGELSGSPENKDDSEFYKEDLAD